MILKQWEDLPAELQVPEVKPYYDVLAKRKLSLVLKRLFDFLAASILLILLAIPMLVIAIKIKKDSDGPIFYRQERVTTYGKTFRIHKFRTMVDGADKIGTAVTAEADPRITEIGAKLRDYRLDELPQLFDVLSGNMSFVGTRPEVPKYVNAYTNEMKATLLLPAGITSEASIHFKDEAEALTDPADADRVYVEEILPQKMQYNLASIKKFNVVHELWTMVKTVLAVM